MNEMETGDLSCNPIGIVAYNKRRKVDEKAVQEFTIVKQKYQSGKMLSKSDKAD